MIEEIKNPPVKDIYALLREKEGKEFYIYAYYYIYGVLPDEMPLETLKEEILFGLLSLEGEEFLKKAYMLILKREIDEDGKKHFKKLLNYRLKEEILDIISRSQEAKTKNAFKFRLNIIKKILYRFLSCEYRLTERNSYKKLTQENIRLNDEITQLKFALGEIKNEIYELKPKNVAKTYLQEVEYIKHAQNECKRLFNRECRDYYILFENIFYNSNAVIELQKIYLPYIRGKNVVDIGCGRGEFLSLLTQNGINAVGVETNPELCGYLTEKGFNVKNTDANTFLKNASGIDTITALEVIEHMDTSYLEEFIKLSYSALNKNGTVVFETVNPLANTGLGNFYMDITHKKPLPPQMMAFWLEYAGFKNIKILYSSPVPKEYVTPYMDKNYQTYAVIGEKI
ncbi:MAG: methyltransferase domain-containing protein [Nautiliaceae bacterium]